MAIYLILFLGMLNWMSFMSSRVLMSLYAIQLDASPAAIGVLIALYGLGPVLLSVQAGKVCDRFGTYWPIVLGSGGLAIGLVIPWLFSGLEVLYFSALVIGAALVFINISIQNLVASFGAEEDRTRNVSLQSLAVALGALLGPLLVGLSIDHRGHVPTFLYLTLIVAASCVAWVACRRMIPHSGRVPKSAPTGGVRELLGQSSLRRIVIMSGLVVAGYVDMSIPFAAGGLYSTTEDLLRWEDGLYGGKLLSPASLARMTTPFKEDYAFGVAVDPDPRGNRVIWHRGAIEGFSASLIYVPAERLSVIVLSNIEGSSAHDVTDDILKITNHEFTMPKR